MAALPLETARACPDSGPDRERLADGSMQKSTDPVLASASGRWYIPKSL
jgi:hypothetical protein